MLDAHPDARFVLRRHRPLAGDHQALRRAARCWSRSRASPSCEALHEHRDGVLRIGAARDARGAGGLRREAPARRSSGCCATSARGRSRTARRWAATSAPPRRLETSRRCCSPWAPRRCCAPRAGERRVPLEAFFVGYRKTALQPGEISPRVELPRRRPAGAARLAYKVSKRRELDISTVAAGFAWSVGRRRRASRDARLGLRRHGGDARARPPHRGGAPGQAVDEAAVERACAARCDEDFHPLTDHRGSAPYRAQVAQNLLRGFFEETPASRPPRLPHAPRRHGPGDGEPMAPILRSCPQLRRARSCPAAPAVAATRAGSSTPAARRSTWTTCPARRACWSGRWSTSPHAHARIVRRDATRARAAARRARGALRRGHPGRQQRRAGGARRAAARHGRGALHGPERGAGGRRELRALPRRRAALVEVEYEPLPASSPSTRPSAARQPILSEPHVIARGRRRRRARRGRAALSGRGARRGAPGPLLPGDAGHARAARGGRRAASCCAPPSTPPRCRRSSPTCSGWAGTRWSSRCRAWAAASAARRRRPRRSRRWPRWPRCRPGAPVKVWLNRDQDMAQTGKRHPFLTRYRRGLRRGRDGSLALKRELFSDGGFSTDLVPRDPRPRAVPPGQRVLHAERCSFTGRVVRTNLPSNTAFRGFGGPQGMCVIEEVLSRAAERLGLDPAEVRRKNFYGAAPEATSRPTCRR